MRGRLSATDPTLRVSRITDQELVSAVSAELIRQQHGIQRERGVRRGPRGRGIQERCQRRETGPEALAVRRAEAAGPWA
jgi:hypothetical protein